LDRWPITKHKKIAADTSRIKRRIDKHTPKDFFIDRISMLESIQNNLLPHCPEPVEERIRNENHLFECSDVEGICRIFSAIKGKEIINIFDMLYESYSYYWEKEGINKFIGHFNETSFEVTNAQAKKYRLAILEVEADYLNTLENAEKKYILQSMSILRVLWYCYYGFYDIKLLASYIKHWLERELPIAETVSTYVDRVSCREGELYYLILGGRHCSEGYFSEKVLGHIGLVKGLDYTKEESDSFYDIKKHILHIDEIHISDDALANGVRVLDAVKVPVRLKNVFEIIRLVKSPFIPNRSQMIITALSTGKMVRKMAKLQTIDNIIIVTDIDSDIVGKLVSQMEVPHSIGKPNNGITISKAGLMFPRWLKDPTNLVSTGPTSILAFSGKDVLEEHLLDGLLYSPLKYAEDIFKVSSSGNKIARFINFANLIDKSICNQLCPGDSSYLIANSNSNNGGPHTGQVGGPEGLSNIMDNDSAMSAAEQYYGQKVKYLPLPPVMAGIDFSDFDKDLLSRAIYPLMNRGINAMKYNHTPYSQITPLGNTYAPTLRNIDVLFGKEKIKEMESQKTLVKNLLARARFLPIINSFLDDQKGRRQRLKYISSVKAKYFKRKGSLNQIRRTTSHEAIFAEHETLFSDTLFIHAGLGTGGLQLALDLRKSIPIANYILIDHGVVDTNNGHQVPTINELGASKLAVTVDLMMKDLPCAMWGSQKNVIGSVVGFPVPYTSKLNKRIIELAKLADKSNIVLVDEIDVTDGETILKKIDFHMLAIDLSIIYNKPVTVVCGLDLGQAGIWRGHFIYEKNSRPFYGWLEFKPGMRKKAERVSPMVLLAPLLAGARMPAEIELLLADMAREGLLEGIGQTVYSSNQSSTHVGNSAILGAIMQALQYSAVEMRKTVKTTYVENPMKEILSREAYHNYSTYPGREGIQLLPFLLYLSSRIYDTSRWPVKWKLLIDSNLAYRLNIIDTALR